MAIPIYTQTTIAMIWDFDRTVIPGYSQDPLFRAYDVDADQFWAEVNELKSRYHARDITVGEDTAYLLHMLTYVRDGHFSGLTNSRLRELGAEIGMCPGMPQFLTEIEEFVRAEPRYQKHDISLEHYIVSTGIKPLIQGSAIGGLVKAIWANEFVDQLPPRGYLDDGYEFSEHDREIAQVGYMIDNTSKTRAVFEINKGPNVHVNSLVAPDERRMPFVNMIYIADGPSDVPVFSVIKNFGGRCLGVYQTGDTGNFEKVKQLEDEGRVHSIAAADYSEGTQAHLWLMQTVREVAERICRDREVYFERIKRPPGHVS